MKVPNCLLNQVYGLLQPIFKSVALWFVVSIGFNLNCSIGTRGFESCQEAEQPPETQARELREL